MLRMCLLPPHVIFSTFESEMRFQMQICLSPARNLNNGDDCLFHFYTTIFLQQQRYEKYLIKGVYLSVKSAKRRAKVFQFITFAR